MYAPLFSLLSKAARETLRLNNYENLFDHIQLKVRAWDQREFGLERALCAMR
jgi:hypothetical protein